MKKVILYSLYLILTRTTNLRSGADAAFVLGEMEGSGWFQTDRRNCLLFNISLKSFFQKELQVILGLSSN